MRSLAGLFLSSEEIADLAGRRHAASHDDHVIDDQTWRAQQSRNWRSRASVTFSRFTSRPRASTASLVRSSGRWQLAQPGRDLDFHDVPFHAGRLNEYPTMTIPVATTAMKAPMSCGLRTRRSGIISGRDRATTLIMRRVNVPIGSPAP